MWATARDEMPGGMRYCRSRQVGECYYCLLKSKIEIIWWAIGMGKGTGLVWFSQRGEADALYHISEHIQESHPLFNQVLTQTRQAISNGANEHQNWYRQTSRRKHTAKLIVLNEFFVPFIWQKLKTFLIERWMMSKFSGVVNSMSKMYGNLSITSGAHSYGKPNGQTRAASNVILSVTITGHPPTVAAIYQSGFKQNLNN